MRAPSQSELTGYVYDLLDQLVGLSMSAGHQELSAALRRLADARAA